MFKDVLVLVAIFSAEQNCLGNFGTGPYEKHLCCIILNLA